MSGGRPRARNAARRDPVIIDMPDGVRYGRLLHWPVPRSERRPGADDRPRRSRSCGDRARVLVGGRHYCVDPDTVRIDWGRLRLEDEQRRERDDELDLDAALTAAEADRAVLG